MSDKHRLADYSTLVAARRRRGEALEKELRDQEAALRAAEAQAAQAAQALARQEQILADYTVLLAGRTSAQARVKLEELEAARRHRDSLYDRCERCRGQLEQARQAVAAAEQTCAETRRKIAVNEDRIAILEEQRDQVRKGLERTREAGEEDEIGDVFGRRRA